MALKLFIGADLVPTKSNYSLFDDVEELVGKELIDLLHDADFTAFNLEVPLTKSINPIKKCGPALIADPASIEGIKKINPHFFTLANNHILDQEVEGLRATMKLLKEHGISYAGAGENLDEASKPFIWEKNGVKVGIYCCAEREFSIATSDRAGVNPFDPFESLDHIVELKAKCNRVIVLYHGGKEHYRYPSPYLQKTCRKIIEKGADLVVCQHSHCIGCKEMWKQGTIVYGQGNFLFDYSESFYWNTSLLLNLIIDEKSLDWKIDYIPICKMKNKVRIAQGDDAQKILSDFESRSQEILKEGFIETQYAEFANSMINNYYGAFSGAITRNLIFRILNKLSGHRLQALFIKMRYKQRDKLALQNFIECEAHRELLLRGLKN